MFLQLSNRLIIAIHTFSREARLRHRKQIDAVFARGRSFMATPYRIYYLVTEVSGKISVPTVEGQPLPVSRKPKILFGVGAGKRFFKKAVDRNRIKRLTREAYRQKRLKFERALPDLPVQIDLFFIYTGKELPTLAICNLGVEQALEKISKIIHQI